MPTGERERVMLDAQDDLRKLKVAGREYFGKLIKSVSPELRQAICNAGGFLEFFYYSSAIPQNEALFRIQAFELARKRLQADQVDDAYARAEQFYNEYTNPKKQDEPAPQTPPSLTVKKPSLPKRSSIDTSQVEPNRIDQSFHIYFNSPLREQHRKSIGDRRYESLREKVRIYLYQGGITPEECGEFSMQTVTRIGRQILNMAKSKPTVFQ